MFEFKRIEVPTLVTRVFEARMAELNSLGTEGWRIKAAYPKPDDKHVDILYLERRIESEA